MQSYERQLQLLCQQLKDTCGPHLKPQAIAPDVHPRGSGSAVCQLQPSTSSYAGPHPGTSSNSSKHSGPQACRECPQNAVAGQEHQECMGQQQAMPEIQQLLHTNQQLLVSLIANCWHQQQQQREHASTASSNATSDCQQAGDLERTHHAPGHIHPAAAAATAAGADPASSKPCSKWMHVGLQQFLTELDSSAWATTTTAGLATAGIQQAVAAKHGALHAVDLSSSSSSNSSSSHSCPQAQHGCDPAVRGAGASNDYSSSSSSTSRLLSWLSAMHPTAAVAVDGVVQQRSSQQQWQVQCNSRDCSSADQSRGSLQEDRTVVQNERQQSWNRTSAAAEKAAVVQDAAKGGGAQTSVTDYLHQQRTGCSTHPNIQPVLLLAAHENSESNSCSFSSQCSLSIGGTSSSSSSGACCMLTWHHGTDAGLLLRSSPSSLGGDWYIRFLLYQLLKGLEHLHSRGSALGGFKLDQVTLIYPGWIQLLAKPAGTLVSRYQQQQQGWQQQTSTHPAITVQQKLTPWPLPQQQPQQQMFVVREPGYSLARLTEMWRVGVISNLEYLMWINAAAGRRWGDRKRHPYVPWVIDFSQKPDLSVSAAVSSSSNSSVPAGWRNLGLSQYRRIKGDAQLDQTYAMSAAAAGVSSTAVSPSDHHRDLEPWTWPIWGSSSDLSSTSSDPSSTTYGSQDQAAVPPHHISNEPMSEMSYAIYMARQMPVELLVNLVRRDFKPEEYPRSIEGLYHSSPDEALPQFYTDPKAFISLHASMSDLAVPAWATDTQDSVNIHRAALESDYVSANLHKWIDLNFGVALSGAAGFAAKNLHLKTHNHNSNSSVGSGASTRDASSSSSSSVDVPVTHGMCQLFDHPHPPRCSSSSSSSSSSSHSQHRPNSNQQLQLGTHPQPAGQQHQQQGESGSIGLPAATTSSSTAAGGESRNDPMCLAAAADPPAPPSPGQLAMCWRDISSLEAASAAGCWSAGPAPTAADSDQAIQQQQQQRRQGLPLVRSHSSRESQQQQQLVPAVAADLAAIGAAAEQLYQQQQQIALTGFSDHAANPSGLAISALNIGLGRSGIPAAAALFIQQCTAGQLSAYGLLHSGFFPPWMEAAWEFMVKLLYTECELHNREPHNSWEVRNQPVDLHYELQNSTADGSLAGRPDHLLNGIDTGASSSSRQASSSSSSNVQCWQQHDAFQALAGLAGPSGALQQLALSLDALRLCLPTVMHVVRSRLLHAAAPDSRLHDLIGSTEQQKHHHQQQQQQQLQGLDFVDSVCVVLLRLASVLPPLLVQQHLVPLLRDMLLTEPHTYTTDIAIEQQRQQGQQQQQQSMFSEAVRVSACRRAALQPLLWQILLTKVAEQQLLRGLLPLLLTAVLEPQHDWLCPCCSLIAAGDGVGDSMAAQQRQGSPSALSAGAPQASGSVPRNSQLFTLGSVQQQQQQQPYLAQVELAANCLSLIAGSLPFPVVCQHMLRPLLLALPWAGSTACTAHGSNAGVKHSTHSTAALGTDQPPNGAAVGLIAIGKVLPPRLAAQFLFQRALQTALLPLLGQPSAGAAAAAAMASPFTPGQHGPGSATAAAAVRRHTAAALPVLESLLDHVLAGLSGELLLPPLGQDFQIPAYVPAAAGSVATGLIPPAAAAAAGGGGSTVSAAQVSSSSSSGKLNSSNPGGPGASSSSLSSVAATAAAAAAASTSSSTPVVQQQQQQWEAADVKLYQLLDLLLLLPPDHWAVCDNPLLYPRIVILVLSAIDQASGSSSSSSGVNALTPATPTTASSSMAGIISSWLLPQVLLPLLGPAVAAAWQQDDLDRRAYWRSVVLLYAGAVRVIGLQEARAQVPAWHSIEVWLTTETGWEAQQTPSSPLTTPEARSRGSDTDIPHQLQLLKTCADRDRRAAAEAASAAADSRATSADRDPVTADLVVCGGSSSSSMQNGPALRIIIRQSSTGEATAEAPAAAAAAAAVRSKWGRLDATVPAPAAAAAAGSSNISGRVTHLLQRIAEEKVVRRSLNTTNEFLEGVGWSQPRPGEAAAAAAAAAGKAGGKQQQRQQQRQKATARRAESAPLAAAAAAQSPKAAVAMPITPQARSSRKEASSSTTAAAAAAADQASATAADQSLCGATAGQLPNSAAAAAVDAVGNVDVTASSQALSTSPPLSVSPPTAAAGIVGSTARRRSWASELNELRLLLESPARQTAAERGPSAGKEWFWLLNPKHEPSHLLPTIHTTAPGSSSSISGSSRPWRSMYGVWWEEGWSLSATALHGWPAHRDKLRALAVDPGERWVVTAGRSSIRPDSAAAAAAVAAGSSNLPGSLTSPTAAAAAVVRVWELADAETKIQYTGHSAAVHKVTFLGPGSSVVASLDVSGAIHVWSRSTGKPLTTFIPEDTSGTSRLSSMRPSTADLQELLPQPAAAAAAGSSNPPAVSPRSSDAARSFTGAANVFADGAAAAAAAAAAVPGSILAQQQSGGFLARGCSSSRGWQDQPALYTRQLSVASDSDLIASTVDYSAAAAAAAASGGSVVAAAPAAALAVGGRLGYTCMVNPSASICSYAYHDTAGYSSSSSSSSSDLGTGDSWHNSTSVLVAGTADGHVCCLDIETGALVDDLVACWEPRPLLAPHSTQQQQLLLLQQQQQSPLLLPGSTAALYGLTGSEDPLSSVMTAVACNISHSSSGSSSAKGIGSSWIAAGSGSGRLMLLDARAGTVLGSWQAHTQRVSQLQGVAGSMGDWQLLSCSLDKTLKLWDLRMLRQPGFYSGSSSMGGFSPVAMYKGSKDGIEGFVVYQDAAIVYGGANLGLAPIDAGSRPQQQQQQQQQQQGWSGATGSSTVTRQIRMTGIRGASRGLGGVSKSGQGLGSSAAVVGLGLLPESKLMVVGQEDGQLRICR